MYGANMVKLPRIFINTITQQKIIQPPAWDLEVPYNGGIMISETDPEGNITYVNRKFIEMSGYTKEELIGMPHSIMRHPDMPKGLFRAMWKTITVKKIWRGYLKNLRKDGKYYWELVYIQPKLDDNGSIIGYSAGRKEAYPNVIKEISALYAKYKDDKYINDPIFNDGASYQDYLAGHGS